MNTVSQNQKQKTPDDKKKKIQNFNRNRPGIVAYTIFQTGALLPLEKTVNFQQK